MTLIKQIISDIIKNPALH